MDVLLSGLGWAIGFIGLGIGLSLLFNGGELLDGIADRLRHGPGGKAGR